MLFLQRYSRFESKKVFWEVEVEGAEDEAARQVQEEFESNLEEYRIIRQAVAKASMEELSNHYQPLLVL